MTEYKLADDPNLIFRLNDKASIPRGHRWWGEYQEWLGRSNAALPADPPPPPGPDTTAELEAALLGTSGRQGRIAARPV